MPIYERSLSLWLGGSTPDLPAPDWRTSVTIRPRLAEMTATAQQLERHVNYALAQTITNAAARQMLETARVHELARDEAEYMVVSDAALAAFRAVMGSPIATAMQSRNPAWEVWWGMPEPLRGPHPISSPPKNGDDKMYVRPEVGTILAYNLLKDRDIAGEYNRLFYVTGYPDYSEECVNLASLGNTDAHYAGYTHEALRINGDNWATLDEAEKIKPGITAYAKRFDRNNYKPSVGDKVLVTHKGDDTDSAVSWVSDMDYMVGRTYTVVALGIIPDRVQLESGFWFDLKWAQPVALVDHKKKLRLQARRNILEKIKSWNSPHGLRGNRRKYYWGEKRGKALAIARNKAQQRDASEAVIAEYLCAVKDFPGGTQERIEPASRAASDRFYNGVWDRIGLVPNTVENALHCLHVSEEDKTKIAYYPTLRHFREAREVRTTLGKYLTKYKDLFGFDENACRTLAQKYVAMQTGEGYKLSFKEQDDPDGWVQVYNDGPHSCMKGEEAVAVYASGVSNLRLAYLEDVSGDIVARCIVRDSDDENIKGYIRVYPDPNGDALGRRLLDLITEAGYGNWTNTKGCLLAYKTTGYGEMICPYIDYGNSGSQYVDKVAHNGTMYLLVGEGEIEADRTDGLVAEEEDNTRACDCCNEYFDEDDLIYVESDDRRVCESCRDEQYVIAYGWRSYPEWLDKDNCSYCETDGNWYHDDYLDNHNVALCERQELYYKLDDLIMTSRGWVHGENCVELAVPDSDGNEWACSADATQLPDGRYIHGDMAEQDFITGEWLLADEDEDGVIQVFTRQLISSNGTSALTHKWTTLKALVDCIDDWVVEFIPAAPTPALPPPPMTCITWKGQEAPGSAVISFRNLTLDMIRNDETFEKIFEYMDEHGLIESQEEAA
jgi:hypothetical protein